MYMYIHIHMRAPWRSLEVPWKAPGSPSASFSMQYEGSLMQTLFSSVQFSSVQLFKTSLELTFQYHSFQKSGEPHDLFSDESKGS